MILELVLASTLLHAHDTVYWDRLAVDAQLEGFHAWYTVQGDPLPIRLELPIVGPYEDGAGGEWWWPWGFSPVREIGLPIQPGAEVCVYVTSYREGAEGAPSNTVCFLWPEVCAFSSREELCACLGSPPDCIYVPPPDPVE